MKRRLLAVLAVLALTLTFAPAVFAGTQGSCGSPTGQSVRLYENLTGDTSDGNDQLWWACNSGTKSEGNLGNIAHTLAGGCNAPFKIGDNWNDCVDSATVWLSSSLWGVCVWKNINFDGGGGSFTSIFGPRTAAHFDFPSPHDVVTSIKIVNNGRCN